MSRALQLFTSFSLVMVLGCGDDDTSPPPLPDGGTGCTTESCPTGEICSEDGVCIPEARPCEDDSSCAAGLVCRDGDCRAPGRCASASDCPTATRCSATMVCIGEDECRTTPDCADGTICSAIRECIPEGSCRANVDCGAGRICNDVFECVPGSDCGAMEFGAAPIAPNLLFVLDRSCSMQARIDGVSKWSAAVSAITRITADFEGRARFGLNMFPDIDRPSCDQTTEQISVDDGNESIIQDRLNDALVRADDWFPKGPCVTNIAAALEQAEMDRAFSRGPDDLVRGDYVVLISDGAQFGCGGARERDPVSVETITRMHEAGVNTFVVGFGGAVDEEALASFSAAGGVPREGSPNYFQADDPDALARDLGEIAASIISCDYALDEEPENLAMTFAFFNDEEEIPRDESREEGWDYDAERNTVTFYGAPCERLRSGMVEDVDIIFGCRGPVIE